jgi:hypothetical protein
VAKKVEHIGFHYESYDSVDELSEDEQVLITKAMEAAENAYAPYSR